MGKHNSKIVAFLNEAGEWRTVEQIAIAIGLRSKAVTGRLCDELVASGAIRAVKPSANEWSWRYGSIALADRITIVEVFGVGRLGYGGNPMIEVEVEVDGARHAVRATLQGGLRFWAYSQLPQWEKSLGRGATIAFDAALTCAYQNAQ